MDYQQHAIPPQADVQSRLDEKMVYLQGFDVKGRPVVYIVGQNIMWRLFSDNELVKRFLVFVLDEAIACMPPAQRSTGKITVLFDLSGEFVCVLVVWGVVL